MAVGIQQLENRDIGLLRQLLELFGRVFNMPETYCAAQPGDDYLAGLLASDSFIAIVALDEGKVIAGLTAYELKKFEQERSEVFIYDLAVDEAYRRKGIATSLISALKPVARSRGAYVIIIEADQGDEPPTALYTKLGTREDVLHFDIPVD